MFSTAAASWALVCIATSAVALHVYQLKKQVEACQVSLEKKEAARLEERVGRTAAEKNQSHVPGTCANLAIVPNAPGAKAKISPPMLKQRIGVFATRTPHRPNPIGITLAKIEKVDLATRSIWVSALDLVDGTPVLDLKPYVPTEHNGETLTGGTLSAITAASKIGGDITVLVSGSNTASIAKEAAAVQGVKAVLHADAAQFDHAIAEELSSLVVTIQKGSNFSHIVAPSSNISKNFLPRVGAALDVAPFTDVLAVVDENTFQRPLYAGNAIATVTSSDSVKLLTVRPTGFEKAATTGGTGAVSAAPAAPAANLTRFVSEETSSSERPDLTAARVVVSGGRGLKSGENFALLNTLADKLKGAVGASRAAVDAGFVPNELQIGQTGKVVAPELYIAVGISGAIQHLAGMKDSKTIVAINKDAEAPIFQVADYGLVEDLFKAVPELTEKI
ncbi:hypothetical protein DYB32_003068 [Aphanomyces invadans]|uniref:TsaA-like domain-containing protein n=1 Tax=Aphanomyces invadans TaxID=157072 RepID=A0A3R7D377_9STRA|nr:hypothetical protein DYB32_003068 [Aphanomyces invadans]